ncbi:hypothetical protein Mgra_00003975 [Meloidogyne graminicola]|uniref:GLOBIN domain-containing protein n=1 Tax=Meloidogyne graminicola TaxID=189291 RepID=A0A8S9ZSF8_9BILA|nr:hypothetical protein Mgra_00003975 [Meloidogyne graminicola]
MFLIAKIVRGRRLLHQLEQQEEKEKAAAKQHEKLSRGVSGVGTVIELVEFPPKNVVEQENRVNEEENTTFPTCVFSSQQQQQKQQVDRLNEPKKRAIRQRTDASLPSDEIEKNEVPDGYSSKAAAMRRTSSMPSIVESEQHLLLLAQQRQQRHLHHSSGNCCLRRGFRASTIRHYNYEDRFTKLHKRALRFTWQRLLTRNGGKRIEVVFEEVFERMMHKIPIMKEMTDTDSGFDPKLLGQAHGYLRPYGFTSALWEAFGEAVIDIVVNQEAVRDLPGASQAWVVLTACLVDQLRAGFDSSLRECPFKHQKSKQKDTQLLMNGGYAAETSSSIEDETEAETFFKEKETNKTKEQLKILIEAANQQQQQQNYLNKTSKIPPINFEDFSNEDEANEENLQKLNKNNNLKYKNSNLRRSTITTLCDDYLDNNNIKNSKFNLIEAKKEEEKVKEEKRRYSIFMPKEEGEENKLISERRINLKFIQNVASTEI